MNFAVWVVGIKDQILEKKRLKTDQQIAKKKTLADQLLQIFWKTSEIWIGPTDIKLGAFGQTNVIWVNVQTKAENQILDQVFDA